MTAMIAFALLLACPKHPAEVPTQVAERAVGGRPGAVCQVRADCVSGAHCDGGVCEYPGPCSSEEVGVDGGLTRTRYRYDDQLRRVGSESERGGVEVAREEAEWSADGTVLLWRLLLEGELESVQRWTYDDQGRQQRLEQGSSVDALTMVSDFRWDDTCLAPSFEWSEAADGSRGRRVVECADGLPVVATTLVDTPQGPQRMRERRYLFDAGLLVGLRFVTGEHDTTVRFVRAPAGYQVGETQDVDGDGAPDSRTTWDLSCWELTDEGIMRR